jgi:hypothetical protein
MKRKANTQTDMSVSRQLSDQELTQVCGGFNPQPDPPARQGMPSKSNPLGPVPEGDRLAIGALGALSTR